jgi:O-antigen ligase
VNAVTVIRDRWTSGFRRLETIEISSRIVVASGATLFALLAGTAAILRLRSIKYLAALIFAGLVVAFFLALRRRYEFLLSCVGFTMPYFVQIILIDRDRSVLAVSGTLLVTAALALVGLVTGQIDKARPLFEPRVSVPMLLFIFAGLLSMVNTTDRTLSFVALAQELEMLFIFLVLLNAIRNEEHLLIFLRGLYLGFAIQCAIYVFQNILGFSFDVLGNEKMVGATDVEAGKIGSQRGTFGNAPATAGLYFSLMTLSLTGIYLCRRKLPIRLPVRLGMMMGGGCLILAAKRASMSGFALGLLVMCSLLPRYCPGALKRLAPVLMTLAIPVLALLPVFLLRADANHQAAYEERMNLTRVAWEMHETHPIVGVGFGTYDSVKREYLPPDWKGWLYTVHNRYLLILAETGLVGLGSFVIWLLMLLRVAFQGIGRIAIAYRPLQISLVCGLLAICWEMFWDIFNSRQQGYNTWFLAALIVILPRALPESRTPESA